MIRFEILSWQVANQRPDVRESSGTGPRRSWKTLFGDDELFLQDGERLHV